MWNKIKRVFTDRAYRRFMLCIFGFAVLCVIVFSVVVGVIVALIGVSWGLVSSPFAEEGVDIEEPIYTIEEAIEITEISFEEPYVPYGDPDNYVYPFNTMCLNDAEIYEGGFRYYTISEEYKATGGCFPEVVQEYLWCLCQEREIDYYIMIALIERESGYQHDASGDGGGSKGYMQIAQKWHEERMAEEGAEDLYNPYQTLRVGLNLVDELYERYGDWGKVLMCYNMGESLAKEYWDRGEYSTDYSRGIIGRAQEIEQELRGS